MIYRNMEWSPFNELSRLKREFESMVGGGVPSFDEEVPPVNIWSGDDHVVLTAELPGIDPNALEITVQNNTVTVRGERKEQDLGDNEEYLRRERRNGNFARSFRLPMRVDDNGVKAEYRRGILELTLPRAEEDKPKKIAVTAE